MKGQVNLQAEYRQFLGCGILGSIFWAKGCSTKVTQKGCAKIGSKGKNPRNTILDISKLLGSSKLTDSAKEDAAGT